MPNVEVRFVIRTSTFLGSVIRTSHFDIQGFVIRTSQFDIPRFRMSKWSDIVSPGRLP